MDWAVDGDTATAGADYTDGSGTLTFAPGDTTKTVTVATLPDTVPEGDETFTVTLSNASNAAIGDADATGTIAANDAVLTALVLSGVTLVPPFDSAETEYTASVASTVENTAVTATPDPAGTAVVIKLGGTEDADATVSLAVGANVITVEVATGSTYTVTVTKAAAVTDNLGPVPGAPTVSTATVNGATLVLTFNETLSATSTPTAAKFTVKVTPDGGSEATRGVTNVAKDAPKGLLTLTLASAVVSTDTVTVSYTEGSGSDYIKDAGGQSAVDFTDQAVTNNTPAAVGTTNNEATGAPTISGTNLVGQTQTANKGTIADTDGLPLESTFTYQWIRVSSKARKPTLPGRPRRPTRPSLPTRARS